MKIIEQNETEIENLCKKYKIEFLAVFGSTASGRNSADSDVDLLVSFKEPVTLFELVRIEREFSDVFDKKVDLVTKKSLNPYIKSSVEEEMTVIYEKAA